MNPAAMARLRAVVATKPNVHIDISRHDVAELVAAYDGEVAARVAAEAARKAAEALADFLASGRAADDFTVAVVTDEALEKLPEAVVVPVADAPADPVEPHSPARKARTRSRTR